MFTQILDRIVEIAVTIFLKRQQKKDMSNKQTYWEGSPGLVIGDCGIN